MQIKDRIFGANIDKKVIEKIKALGGGGLSGNEGDELSERKPTFEKYLGEKTPFARMWTGVALVNEREFEVTPSTETPNGTAEENIEQSKQQQNELDQVNSVLQKIKYII